MDRYQRSRSGVPLTLIGESVFARILSSLKDERVRASAILGPKQTRSSSLSVAEKTELIAALRDALYASKICSYAQGFQLMRAAAQEHNWELNLDLATYHQITIRRQRN